MCVDTYSICIRYARLEILKLRLAWFVQPFGFGYEVIAI